MALQFGNRDALEFVAITKVCNKPQGTSCNAMALLAAGLTIEQLNAQQDVDATPLYYLVTYIHHSIILFLTYDSCCELVSACPRLDHPTT